MPYLLTYFPSQCGNKTDSKTPNPSSSSVTGFLASCGLSKSMFCFCLQSSLLKLQALEVEGGPSLGSSPEYSPPPLGSKEQGRSSCAMGVRGEKEGNTLALCHSCPTDENSPPGRRLQRVMTRCHDMCDGVPRCNVLLFLNHITHRSLCSSRLLCIAFARHHPTIWCVYIFLRLFAHSSCTATAMPTHRHDQPHPLHLLHLDLLHLLHPLHLLHLALSTSLVTLIESSLLINTHLCGCGFLFSFFLSPQVSKAVGVGFL